MKYIKKIDERSLYNDGIGKIELYDFSRANENEESRIEAVSTVASQCYGKPPKDAKKLVERLWTESGGLPSSAFEFVRAWNGPSINDSLRNSPGLAVTSERLGDLAAGWHKERIATFRLTVPIFTARQIRTHRTFSYQELSRRRVTDKRVPLSWWMVNDSMKRHNIMAKIYEQEWIAYHELMKEGVPAEEARAVLGVGLYTTFWMQGHVPAWQNFFKLRLDSHAQKECREAAQAMADLLADHQSELWEKVKP